MGKVAVLVAGVAAAGVALMLVSVVFTDLEPFEGPTWWLGFAVVCAAVTMGLIALGVGIWVTHGPSTIRVDDDDAVAEMRPHDASAIVIVKGGLRALDMASNLGILSSTPLIMVSAETGLEFWRRGDATAYATFSWSSVLDVSAEDIVIARTRFGTESQLGIVARIRGRAPIALWVVEGKNSWGDSRPSEDVRQLASDLRGRAHL